MNQALYAHMNNKRKMKKKIYQESQKKKKFFLAICWVPVAHICNPSYSGGSDQEDCDSKPAQANSSQDPNSKKPIMKRAGRDVGPEFKPQPSITKKKVIIYRKKKG
jgi:hypothetical protein